jgi:hypothetical protein
MSADRAARLVEHAWINYQQGRIGRVVGELPKLVNLAQVLEGHVTPTDRQVWAVLARCTTLRLRR